VVEINVVDEFREWYDSLSDTEEERVTAVIDALEEQGVNLREPYSKPIKGSRHDVMHELRPRHKGDPIRVLYCFDPRRQAVLLVGGDKTGDPSFYDRMIPIADDLYEEYLEELRQEGEI
jgi:hypothetical protein